MQLKEKQEKFCQNYVLHKNATRAAKDAGYSDISAHNTGSRLLQDPASTGETRRTCSQYDNKY